MTWDTSAVGERPPTALLLSASQVRQRAATLGIRPTKMWGQNFLIDANTVRRILTLAQVSPGQHVLEVGPGLGSLTLGLLHAVGRNGQVVAVEIDPLLAQALPQTVEQTNPQVASALTVRTADALRLTSSDLASQAPTALVANLPYNVAVPVVLHLLEIAPSITSGLVMVQAEVADRLTATPGTRVYGVPSVKLAWHATAHRAGKVGRTVFWPAPRVDSALVSFTRVSPPSGQANRQRTFEVIDAAFAQRRKTLRAALAQMVGSAQQAQAVLEAANVNPHARAETLTPGQFARIAAQL